MGGGGSCPPCSLFPKTLSLKSILIGEKVLASSTNGRIPLTSLEESRLKETTRDELNQEQLGELIDLVSQIHLKQIELEAEKADSMRKTLCEILPPSISENMTENILSQWQMIQKRIFYYQEVAARYVGCENLTF